MCPWCGPSSLSAGRARTESARADRQSDRHALAVRTDAPTARGCIDAATEAVPARVDGVVTVPVTVPATFQQAPIRHRSRNRNVQAPPSKEPMRQAGTVPALRAVALAAVQSTQPPVAA